MNDLKDDDSYWPAAAPLTPYLPPLHRGAGHLQPPDAFFIGRLTGLKVLQGVYTLRPSDLLPHLSGLRNLRDLSMHLVRPMSTSPCTRRWHYFMEMTVFQPP